MGISAYYVVIICVLMQAGKRSSSWQLIHLDTLERHIFAGNGARPPRKTAGATAEAVVGGGGHGKGKYGTNFKLAGVSYRLRG